MNLLGWVRAPEQSLAQWDAHTALAASARADGLDRTLVCGMGGSSLVADVLASAFGARTLRALDGSRPAAVAAAVADDALRRSLSLLASKSCHTVETLAFCQHSVARARPDQFVAITESGSPLDTSARQRGFRAVIPHPPGMGGRYSALTAIGMLPAALIGVDGRTLLERTGRVDVAAAERLGSAVADRAKSGRDKLRLAPPREVGALAQWVEQLIAESSGKDGRGVVPIVDDPLDASLPDLQTAGPAEFSADPLDLGREFLRWEYATKALCERLGVNAFDQPDVEEAKRLARAERVPARTSAVAGEPIETLSPAALRRTARSGDYFAILAYLPPGAGVLAQLQRLPGAWGRTLRCATTLGIGPRYLHSTGQLHKGGPNSGLFLVITVETTEGIPDRE